MKKKHLDKLRCVLQYERKKIQMEVRKIRAEMQMGSEFYSAVGHICSLLDRSQNYLCIAEWAISCSRGRE